MIVAFAQPDAWTVECTACDAPGAPAGIVGRRFAALVPGCVHLDLERAGVIPPVDHGDGEMRQAWVGHADWTWRGSVVLGADALAQERVELVFGSIDTVARVLVNGVHVGDAASQFCTQRFDVKSAVREGANAVVVEVRAPVPYVLAEQARLGPRPVNGDWTPYPFVRKSACNFGWDWGPRVPTSGLGGSARIEAWGAARIDAVRPLVLRCDESSATVAVHVDAVRAARGGIPVVAEVELETPAGDRIAGSAPLEADGRATVTLEIPRPMRWWPRGRGAQHLHDLRVRLVAEGARRSQALHAWRRRIGLRSVALDTAPDAHGSRFALVVNGEHVAVVGANWIPAQLFPEAPDGGRTDRLLELACDAHLNMLRVWGGGIYEPERFYERCDELGIMVWQDFMFACATYPEDAPMPALVEREAREQVARLASHPSVVLWCGGNEDVLAWQSWGFKERLATGQSWGLAYWTEILPRVCREVDPTRPYWTESPWSGSLERHANDPDHGDRHTWDLKLEAYSTMVPRWTT
jgi:beta-mannosidase